ncbi:hypothetical protein V8F06_001800 [Rhypophila decipiens]
MGRRATHFPPKLIFLAFSPTFTTTSQNTSWFVFPPAVITVVAVHSRQESSIAATITVDSLGKTSVTLVGTSQSGSCSGPTFITMLRTKLMPVLSFTCSHLDSCQQQESEECMICTCDLQQVYGNGIRDHTTWLFAAHVLPSSAHAVPPPGGNRA